MWSLCEKCLDRIATQQFTPLLTSVKEVITYITLLAEIFSTSSLSLWEQAVVPNNKDNNGHSNSTSRNTVNLHTVSVNMIINTNTLHTIPTYITTLISDQ